MAAPTTYARFTQKWLERTVSRHTAPTTNKYIRSPSRQESSAGSSRDYRKTSKPIKPTFISKPYPCKTAFSLNNDQMRAALLLVGLLASLVNAYYYEVDVRVFNKDQWMKCVNLNTFDFKGIDPSTGNPWGGLGGTCLFSIEKDLNRVLKFSNRDWRLNQFYNVSITPGEVYNHVPSLKTQETGLVIPCTLADEYHALAGTPEDQMPSRVPNHWLYVCTAPELFRNRTDPVVPTSI
ncbi:hypothetical protein BGZ83_007262 [Gryganskiella cystojenkinii]|nr:hypothetical protein BGZ83_007262 [Gryganskiella cystojenkinii]